MKRIAFVLLALAPASANAITLQLLDHPLQINITEYGAVAYTLDNGNIAPAKLTLDDGRVIRNPNYDPTSSNYVAWLNRFQIDGSWREFTALLRVDTDLFFHAPQAAPDDTATQAQLKNRYGQRLDLEKVAIGYTSRQLEVTLGDFYVTYGRGLVLAMRKEDELGVDTTLRGASVTGHIAGLNANVVAGVSNILNIDTATAREADDPNDVILGARAEYRFGKWVVPGIDISHVIYARNIASTPQETRDQITAYSATLELPYLWGYGNLYFEYARLHKTQFDQFVKPVPTAFYAAATAYVGRATLLLEYKNYQHYPPIFTSLQSFEVPELALTDFYNEPPTLERVQQPLLDNTDVTGPHARVEVAVTPNFAPFVSMAGFKNRKQHIYIYDPYAGFELKWQDARSRMTLSGGYRATRIYDGPNEGKPYQDTLHFEYDINQWLTGPYSIEVDGLHMTFSGTGAYERTWHEGQAYLSFKKADAWSVAAGYEYYTEFGFFRSNYPNASGSVNIGKSVLLRLFVGGQRAGIKCVNGVCRNYPAFDGARAEVLAKF